MSDVEQAYSEEKSQRELASTEVGPVTARVLSWAFALLLVVVPAAQAAREAMGRERVQALALFRPVGDGLRSLRAGRPAEAWRAFRPLLDRKTLGEFEKSLEASSFSKGWVQPRLQALLTGALRAGNGKCAVGRSGWLFHQPGVEYLAGPDFLDPAQLEIRSRRMTDRRGEPITSPDPRPAILQLHRGCRNAGIRLVVVPVPDKAMLRGDLLTGRPTSGPDGAMPNNPGFAAFVRTLEAEGVDVFDLSAAASRADGALYLRQDTHWTPAFMEASARALAEHVRGILPPEAASRAPHSVRDVDVSRVGDLVDLLKLPPDQRLYLPQTVRIRQVVDPSGRPWEPCAEAEVLLLGDSFTNIYSSAALGWGEGAGLAAQLSVQLARPVDVIAMNGAGASGTRRELARAENVDRLAGKRVLIYEFGMQDLAMESWELAPFSEALFRPRARPAAAVPGPAGGPARSAPSAPRAVPAAPSPVPAGAPGGSPLVVTGTVVRTSRVPEPYAAPYADCLTFVEIRVERVESGAYGDRTLLVAVVAMRDNTWLPGARWSAGERLRLTLVPLKEAGPEIRALQRSDDIDDYDHLPYFVVSEGKP